MLSYSTYRNAPQPSTTEDISSLVLSKAGESSETTVEEVLKEVGSHASRREVVQVLKDLEEAGAGRFVVGRRGTPTRIQWSSNASRLLSRKDQQPSTVELALILGSGEKATLSLPSNMTPEDVSVVVRFLEAFAK